ncbi:hypothetical protein K7432_011471 [Basidiobolus ranarum]|uniref:Uncharacterized protein n=1 Tax=Basidiobolus ranarum TaxID=34480 RepID=A0ABR2WM88_9FUNG
MILGVAQVAGAKVDLGTCKPPKPPVQPPKPPVNPPTYEKSPCKTCKPPRPPVYPPISTIRPLTPGKPCSPKSCKAIITKIRTVCGTDIDINFCLNLRVNIDFLRLDSLKCRMVVSAAQIAGVSVDLGVCNRLDSNEYNDHSHPNNSGYGYGGGHRNNEAGRYHY